MLDVLTDTTDLLDVLTDTTDLLDVLTRSLSGLGFNPVHTSTYLRGQHLQFSS